MDASTDMLYFNNAATSYPKPPCVGEAVKEALDGMPGAGNRGGIESFDAFDAARRRLAPLLGVGDHRRIALGPNATWALNLAIFGLPLKKNAVILSTKSEHNSVLRPLYAREQREGLSVVYLDVDEKGRISPEAWARALEVHRPAFAVFTHASNVTGAVNDGATLTRLAKSNGAATLLDASQTLGWLPVEGEAWGVDMIAFTGHKYLLGPQGTGGLYLRDGLELQPWLVGGTGIHSDLAEMPDEMPLHLEAGTGNEPSFHGLLAALDWAEENPLHLRGEEEKLQYLKDGLQEAGALIIRPSGPCTPVVSFTIEGCPAEDAYDILTDSYDVICRAGLHCAPKIFPCLGMPGGTLRVSLSRFTTMEEIDQLTAAVADIAASL